MAESIVTWGEPPASGKRGRHALSPLRLQQFEALKSRPGQWAIVDSGPNQGPMASVASVFKRRGFEAITRKNDAGTTDVWARWNNDDEEN